MALTLGNLRSFLQTKLGDTTDDTKTLIDQMINAAYMSIVTRLKVSGWRKAEKSSSRTWIPRWTFRKIATA